VGTYAGDASYYGTYDQGGNVWEWNDAVIGSSRGLGGGSWLDNEYELRASVRYTATSRQTSSSPSGSVLPEAACLRSLNQRLCSLQQVCSVAA